MKRLFVWLVLTILFPFVSISGDSSLKVLILSGRNNHEWQKTTPSLVDILNSSGIFTVFVTNQPDTITSGYLEKFDVILNNWNSWPENDLLWPAESGNALLRFIENGGGFVTFHASTSVFYQWPDFQKIVTAAWIQDTTSHGKCSETEVIITDPNHPVTKGMNNFVLFDELWINAGSNPEFTPLGYATNAVLSTNGSPPQPAIFVATYGKGRIFHTILGHDTRAMENKGFISVLLRGTEWSATGKVTQQNY